MDTYESKSIVCQITKERNKAKDETFHRLSSELRVAAEKNSDGASIAVLVDVISPDHLHPLSVDPWNAAVAMLILSFPEARWIFGQSCCVVESDHTFWEKIIEYHGIHSLFAANWNPLFDGSGLREWVRARSRGAACYLPERRQLAAALDEESAYADFHAYTAYRFGFRAFALTTDSAARYLAAFTGNPTALSFEDIYLNFADKIDKGHYSDIETRAGWYPALHEATRRYFITVGHRFGHAEGLFSVGNQLLLRQLREEGRGGLVLTKPVAGMHGIWTETGLSDNLTWFDPKDGGRRRVGVGEGFVWPPIRPEDEEPLELGGHSAPGRLLQVAEHLIHRAEKLVGEVKNTQDAVRGAVMATDALELLGCRTPTLARDALELKHRFEALAECQFGGVEYNLNLEPRFFEIRRDVEAICVWFGPEHRKSSLLNGELTIISRLVTVFRAYNEYDEEEACMRRIRTLQTELWARKQGFKMSLLWPVWLLRRYVEWVVVSPQRLFGVILASLTVVFLGLLWTPGAWDANLWPKIATSINAVFGAQPSTKLVDGSGISKAVTGITCFGAVAGFLHLGIFISRLYAVISRK